VFLSLTPSTDDDGTGAGDATPTREVGVGVGGAATPVPGTLPQTGFGDNPSDVGVIALMAFGLLGIIFGARRLRAANTI